jgi:HK97 family phage prohead protease
VGKERIQSADFEWTLVLDDAKAQVAENDDGDLIIEGYAADFRTDRDNEMFEKDAFEDGLKSFLDTNPVLLYHHKKALALGRVLSAKIDDVGVFIKAMLDKPEPGTFAADVYRKVKSGTIRGFSVGGKFYRRFTAAGPTRIFQAEVHEISCTPQPVNPFTLATVGAKAFDELDDELAGTNGRANDAGDEPDAKALDDAVNRLESLYGKIAEARSGRAPAGS